MDDNMQKMLYEKIGRQELAIEVLRNQTASLSSLLSKFVSGEEKPENWTISPQGQLVKKGVSTGNKSVLKNRKAKQ